jgi:hypothetical protein
MDLIFYLTRSAPATDAVFPESTLVSSDKTSTFKYKCNKIAKQHYLELWTKQAHSLKEGKLRTYLKICMASTMK